METPPPNQPNPQPQPQPQAPYYPPPSGPSIRFDVIGKAFNMIFADIGTWVVAAIILLVGVGIVESILYFIAVLPMMSGSMGGFIVMMFMFVVSAFVVSAVANVLISNMYRMALIALGGDRPSVNEMFKFGSNVGNIVVGALLVGLLISVGAIACYIGAFVVGGLLMFTMPLIVDRNMPATDAMKLSFETLKKDVVMAAVFFLVIGLCASIGFVACGIGIFFTFPVMPLAIAMLYRDYFGGAPATVDQAPAPVP
jgi:hypothetical protein